MGLLPLDVALVVGHTADRPGATAVDGTSEYTWGQQVVKAARRACGRRGLVAQTFEKVPFGTYADRLQKLTAEVNQRTPRWVVEVHFNAAPPAPDDTDPEAWRERWRGTYALHWPSSEGGRQLARVVSKHVSLTLGTRLRHGGALGQARSWNGPPREDEHGQPVPGGPYLYTLKWTVAPAILLETHYGTSRQDQELAADQADGVGTAIAHALKELDA